MPRPLYIFNVNRFVPGPPTRFVSVNGACSWTSLHLPFVNVTMGFENRPYLLVTDVFYHSSTREHSRCAFLFPSLHSLPLNSFWNSCRWDTSVGLKTGVIWTCSDLDQGGESAWEAHSQVAGKCWCRALLPSTRVYPYLPWESTCELGVPGKWSGKHSFSFPLEISFFVVSLCLKWHFSAFRF